MRKKNKDFIKSSISRSSLQNRMKFNKASLYDFDEWSINLLPKLPMDSHILDLGCGTGKQILNFSKFFSPNTVFHGYDIAKESIDELINNYTSNPQLKTNLDNFENIEKHFSSDEKFELIYSFYALYYTNNLKKLVEFIYDHLKEDSYLWVVTPFEGTNNEVFKILNKYYEFNQKVFYSINKFYKELIQLCRETGYKNIKVNRLNNKIFFNNAESLYSYISNTTFYNNEFDEQIKNEIETIFKEISSFSLSKNVLSLIFEK